MRSIRIRPLPPFLRVARIMGLLCLVTSIALLSPVWDTRLPFSPQTPVEFSRMVGIALNLNFLGMACFIVVSACSARRSSPDRGLFALGSWQGQARAIALLAALPLCALVLALMIPATQPASFIGASITLFAGFMLIVAYLWSFAIADR